MDTLHIFYKIYKGDVNSHDYISWALKMLHNECSSYSLNILSSLKEPINIFEVEEYFRRSLRELNLEEPSYDECALYYIGYLSRKILGDEDNAIDIADEIHDVVRDLDYPEDLEEWINICDMIDDYRYGDNHSKLTKAALIMMIVNGAKNQLERNRT